MANLVGEYESKIDEQLAKGNRQKALEYLEHVITLQESAHGPNSVEVKSVIIKVVEEYNAVAMQLLEEDKLDEAFVYLRKAESMSEGNANLKAITSNNLGCFYRKKNQPRSALIYLLAALELEAALPQSVQGARSPADTHLNICTVLSELKRHPEALKHAKAGLKLLLLEICDPEHPQGTMRVDRAGVLTIAYHNLGVQHEFLKDYAAASTAYTKASLIAEKYLGDQHSLTRAMKQALESSCKIQPECLRKAPEKKGGSSTARSGDNQGTRRVPSAPSGSSTSRSQAKSDFPTPRLGTRI